MIAFIAENLATILISSVLLAVVVWISINLMRKKKSGKSVGCGCGCDSCPNAMGCHKS